MCFFYYQLSDNALDNVNLSEVVLTILTGILSTPRHNRAH